MVKDGKVMWGPLNFGEYHLPKGVGDHSGFEKGKNVYVAITRSHIFFSLGTA